MTDEEAIARVESMFYKAGIYGCIRIRCTAITRKGVQCPWKMCLRRTPRLCETHRRMQEKANGKK